MASELVELAIQRILDHIYSGNFPVAKRLPAENALAKLLGVSRMTMREAVRTLAERKVLTVTHGVGIVVNSPDAWVDLATLDWYWAKKTNEYTSTLMLLELHKVFASYTSFLAALRRTKEDLALLYEYQTQLEKAELSDDSELSVQAGKLFHDAIATAAHNPFLSASFKSVVAALANRKQLAIVKIEERERRIMLHRKILRGIAEQDPRKAQRAMAEHMDQLRDEFRRSLPKQHK